MKDLKAFIAQARWIEGKATPGVWESDFCGDVWSLHSELQKWSEDDCFFRGSVGTTRRGPDSGDAAFIAFSRNNFLSMLDTLEAQAEAIEVMLKEFDENVAAARVCLERAAAILSGEKP